MENVKLNIHSDHLHGFRELLAFYPTLVGLFGFLPQLRLVIDSNIVLSELIWLVTKRRNPTARTALQEVIASGTIVAFAPEKLREEIKKHIKTIATDKGISEELLYTEWQNYEKYLHFCPVDALEENDNLPKRDPADLPFIYLYSRVGASAIVSWDKDIQRWGRRQ